MAETKKTTATEKTVETRVKTLKRDPNPRAPQAEFYSHNFKNYMIKRGVPVEVPEGIAQIIDDQEEAEAEAARFADELREKNERPMTY